MKKGLISAPLRPEPLPCRRIQIKGMNAMLTKVAIIDDNPITVRSLTQTIDWASRGCVIAGTAHDG